MVTLDLASGSRWFQHCDKVGTILSHSRVEKIHVTFEKLGNMYSPHYHYNIECNLKYIVSRIKTVLVRILGGEGRGLQDPPELHIPATLLLSCRALFPQPRLTLSNKKICLCLIKCLLHKWLPWIHSHFTSKVTLESR